MSDTLDFVALRSLMVDTQLRVRGVKDERVLDAMNTVPRHLFVPPEFVGQAYNDYPLPIGSDQTISQPYIVAAMAEAGNIKITDHVLEIGSGCGYSAVVLSTLAHRVTSAEIIESLGNAAKQRVKDLGYKNVEILVQDGSVGFEDHAPFDVIIVTAGAPSVPFDLLFQLSVGGRMIVPVHKSALYHGLTAPSTHKAGEQLLRITRTSAIKHKSSFVQEVLEEVRFVPLRGKAGWK